MNWNKLTEKEQLQAIKDRSATAPVVIFKHSTRCSVSSAALNRIERAWNEEQMKEVVPYYLDLIRYRDISNSIESEFGVVHESPQVLLIRDGKCIYTASHMGIIYNELVAKSQA